MPFLGSAVLLALLTSTRVLAMDCPNCELEFPSAWSTEEAQGNLLVDVEGTRISLMAQEDETLSPMSGEEVELELAALRAELTVAGLQVEQLDGTLLRTPAEPMVKLAYHWTDAQGGAGEGLRLVRRCGVRLVFDQRADEADVPAVVKLAERVRYTAQACRQHNAYVLPLPELELEQELEKADVEAPADPAVQDDAPLAPPVEPVEDVKEEASSWGLPLWVVVGLGALALMGLLLLLRRGGESQPLRPPRRAAPAPRPAPSPDSAPPTPLRQAEEPPPQPAEEPLAEPDEPPDADLEDLEYQEPDAPVGTYGMSSAGGGAKERPAPQLTPISRPLFDEQMSKGTVKFDATLPGEEPDQFDPCAALRRLAEVLPADMEAPGVDHPAFVPQPVASLLAAQNGGRYGLGWLLLLGFGRRDMDLRTYNLDQHVKQRFGEGWMVGVFAFGSVLWAGDGGRSWEIRGLDGTRVALGSTCAEALGRLADVPELRQRGADIAAVARCRAAVGELQPGFVYRLRQAKPSDPPRVELVRFTELVAGRA